MSSQKRSSAMRGATPDPAPQKSVGKARRPLPLTVRGDQGLREGEVWMLGRDEIAFWCGEQLGVGERYEMRIDLRGYGHNVDLEVRIREVQVGRTSGVKHGYLHHAAYDASTPERARRLQEVFWRLNPEHTPEDPSTTQKAAKRPTRAGRSVSHPRTTRDNGGRRVRRKRRGPLSEFSAGGESPRTTPLDKRSSAAVRPDRHRRPDSEAPSGPIPAHTQRVVPQLGSGDPLQVLLHFPDRALLRTCTRLEGSHAYFVTGPERSLEIMQRITLHLQLPLGFFITLAGRVRESTDHHCVIAAHRVNHSLLANLRMALGLTPEE